MKNRIVPFPSALLAVALALAGTGFAQTPAEELEALKKRVGELEQLVRERPTPAAETSVLQKPESGGAMLFDRLSITGLVEVEAAYSRTRSKAGRERESDLTLATVELGIEAQITDWITASAVFLWEEDGSDSVELDTATILFADPERFPLTLEIGKFYLPFGRFDSVFITDPLTLEIGETRESAVRLGFVHGPFQLGVSVFNGDVEKTGKDDNHLDSFVVDASLEWEWEDGSLAFGAAYTSNLGDSDGLQDAIADNAGGGTLDDHVAGLAAWLSLRYRRATFSAEYLAALDDFAPNSLSFDGPGNDWTRRARPQALNLELAYLATDRLTFAAKFEQARDTFDWLPKRRYGVGANYVLHEGDYGTASVGLEYLRGVYDDADDTREDTLTLQFAVEF